MVVCAQSYVITAHSAYNLYFKSYSVVQLIRYSSQIVIPLELSCLTIQQVESISDGKTLNQGDSVRDCLP